MRSRTLATLTLIALLAGCGDGSPGTVPPPNAPEDVMRDSTSPPDGQSPPPDVAPMDDVTTTPDATPPIDTGVDAVEMDVPTPPPDAAEDVPVKMDTAPPPDVAEPDATPPDTVEPDATPVDVPTMTELPGHTATALVAHGTVMRSSSYKLVSTLGQSSIHQTVMRSVSYRLRGGLVGATGGSR